MSESAKPRVVLPPATPEEAAAIAAAVERFLRDHAPAAPQAPRASGWTRAARLEAVGAGAPGGLAPWGDPHPWR